MKGADGLRNGERAHVGAKMKEGKWGGRWGLKKERSGRSGKRRQQKPEDLAFEM